MIDPPFSEFGQVESFEVCTFSLLVVSTGIVVRERRVQANFLHLDLFCSHYEADECFFTVCLPPNQYSDYGNIPIETHSPTLGSGDGRLNDVLVVVEQELKGHSVVPSVALK